MSAEKAEKEISRSQVSEAVRSAFQVVLNGKEVDEGFSLNDEGIDSLTRVEIVMELESVIASEFSIKESIPEQFTEGISTVGELNDKLYTFLNEKIISEEAE